jgi:hypothetical protein
VAVYYWDPSDLDTSANPIADHFTAIWAERTAHTTSTIVAGTTPAGTKYWRFGETSGATTWNWHFLEWTGTGAMPATDGSVEALYCYRRSDDSYATGNVCFRVVDPYDEAHGSAGFTGGDRNNTTEVRTRYIWDDVAFSHFAANHGLTLTTNTWYWCRVRLTNDGTDCHFKIRLWKDGDSEPSAWQLEETESSPMTHAGKGGIYIGCRSSATFDIAWFSYATEGDTAPSEKVDCTVIVDVQELTTSVKAPTTDIDGDIQIQVDTLGVTAAVLDLIIEHPGQDVDVQALALTIHTPVISVVVGTEPIQEFHADRGNLTLGGHEHLTLPRAVVYERAFMRITGFPYGATGLASGSTTPPDPYYNYYRCRLLDNTTYCLQRAWDPSSDYPNRVMWELWEYTGNSGGQNEFIVRLTGGCELGASTTQRDFPVTGIQSLAKCVPFITGVKSADLGTTNRSAVTAVTAEMVVSGGLNYVRLRRATHGDEPVEVTVSVVEFVGSSWTVQTVTHSFTAANTIETESITSVGSTTNAFVYGTHRHLRNDYRNSGVNVWMSSATAVGFRLERNATPADHNVVAYVLSNPNLDVIHFNSVDGTNEVLPADSARPQTQNRTLPRAVADLARAGVICHLTYDGTASNTSLFFQYRLTTATNLQFWRNLCTSYSNWTAQVVQFPEDISGISATVSANVQTVTLAQLDATLDISLVPITEVFLDETLAVQAALLDVTTLIVEATRVEVPVFTLHLGFTPSGPIMVFTPPDVFPDAGVAICSYCGIRLRPGQEYRNRDGLMVCKTDQDPTHPQDQMRPRKTGEGKAKRKHNPETGIVFITRNINPEEDY